MKTRSRTKSENKNTITPVATRSKKAKSTVPPRKQPKRSVRIKQEEDETEYEESNYSDEEEVQLNIKKLALKKSKEKASKKHESKPQSKSKPKLEPKLKSEPKSKPEPKPDSKSKAKSQKNPIKVEAVNPKPKAKINAPSFKNVGGHSLRGNRVKVNYKEDKISSSENEQACDYAPASRLGAMSRRMNGRSHIRLGATKPASDDDIIFSSDPDIAKQDINVQEIDEINQQFSSDDEKDENSKKRRYGIPQKRPRSMVGKFSEDEYVQSQRSGTSNESDVSLVSDYVPENYFSKPKPSKPKQYGVMEILRQSKYKKLQKASKDSYLKLDQGIDDNEEGVKDKQENNDEDENENESKSSQSDISVIYEPWDLLPYKPSFYKGMRLPDHLKWVTTQYHYNRVHERIIYQEYEALEREIYRLRFLKKLHTEMRRAIGFPIGIMQNACKCCGQWTIKKHFCLHEICSPEECRHKRIILDSRKHDRTLAESGDQPRRGRPRKFFWNDPDFQSKMLNGDSQNYDMYTEDDIFAIVRHTHEERKQYSDEFFKKEAEKAQEMKEKIEEIKKKQSEIQQAKDEQKRKRELKSLAKLEEKIKKQQNKGKPKRTRKSKAKLEDAQDTKSSNKRTCRKLGRNKDINLSEMMKELLPDDSTFAPFISFPREDNLFESGVDSSLGLSELQNSLGNFTADPFIPKYGPDQLFQSNTLDPYNMVSTELSDLQNSMNIGGAQVYPNNINPQTNNEEQVADMNMSYENSKPSDKSYCNAFDDLVEMRLNECDDSNCSVSLDTETNDVIKIT